jgi:GNAT superfamily N-acetyltransferase
MNAAAFVPPRFLQRHGEHVVKPLLIIPPAPARWPLIQQLPLHDDPLWQDDLERRLAIGLPRTQDAFAVIADGGKALAAGCICKRHDIGVLNRVFTHQEHRRAGLARKITETLLSWFDMTGGRWLYATTTADLAADYFSRFGFRIIRRAPRSPNDAAVILRTAADAPEDPLLDSTGPLTVHDVSRANWPTMAVLLYNRPGADPRLSPDETAVSAEQTSLTLISQLEAGACRLKAAFRGPRLVALASVAAQTGSNRTYAMIMPHTEAPDILRAAIAAQAQADGYDQVEFPMETLCNASRDPDVMSPATRILDSTTASAATPEHHAAK